MDHNTDVPEMKNINPSARDGMIPLDFFDVFVNRYLPVLSCTYVASVIVLALQRGVLSHFIYYFLQAKTTYCIALLVGVWFSNP